ncbi:ABC transporter substrate-binding protein [Pandoraea anhela]|uniref:ABC transporter substrate-binding protein n=1 Tax=Pandoraea anhela TaxID=2508295 RepID=A0A5E4WDK5_9BURK|nr:ABC transporter substrate-binding protein [Pandoraea anhela]VVE23177.1 ABC transporter substrate-binding protein [Pandoraea anhela]
MNAKACRSALRTLLWASMLPWCAALAHADEIKVGVIQVLTGPNARFGAQTYSGIQLAAEEINAGGGVKGSVKLRLITEDSTGNKEQAVSAMRRLIANEKVDVVVGPTLSAESIAAAPVACQRGIPMLTVNATAKGIPDVCQFIFRTSLSERQLIPLSVKNAMTKHKMARVAIFYANDDPNMVESYTIYKETAARFGIEVVDVEAFATHDTDFSAQITKVKSLGVDAIWLGSYPETGAAILTQARKIGMGRNIVFIGGNGFNSPSLVTLAGTAAEGLIVSSPWFVDNRDAANQTFVARYRAKYQKDPDTYAAQGYQGMMLLASALNRETARTPQALRDAMAGTRMDGLFGPFSFAPNRDPASVGNAITLQIKDGRFQPL